MSVCRIVDSESMVGSWPSCIHLVDGVPATTHRGLDLDFDLAKATLQV